MIAWAKVSFSYSAARVIEKGHPMEVVEIALDDSMESGVKVGVKGLAEGVEEICLSLVVEPTPSVEFEEMVKRDEMETIRKLLEEGETEKAWLALEMQLLTEEYGI